MFRSVERPDYGTGISQQLMAAAERKGPGDLQRAAALQRHLVGAVGPPTTFMSALATAECVVR